MTIPQFVFTSESVSRGHPDKVCDQISDAILDLYLNSDSQARVACETLACTNTVVLAGEIRGPEKITKRDREETVRKTVQAIGYEQDDFHWDTLNVLDFMTQQSPDIAQGVDESENHEEGAGDQGMMFGYACRETDELMPAAIFYAHRILETLRAQRDSGELKGLGVDAKTQLSVLYKNGKPTGLHSFVLSTQHHEKLTQKEIRNMVLPVVESVVPAGWMCASDKIHINPTGRFVLGGPAVDTGLTGRKIIVDTYGGSAPHGGGAFSGKDPTKVDRSAAYAARYMSKNIVAAGLADKCTIQVSYAIGVAQPVSVYVNTHDTSKLREEEISEVIQKLMPLSPKGIRTKLNLNRPIYSPTAYYGHFGRKVEKGFFPWEALDLVKDLKAHFGNENFSIKAA